MNSKTLALIKNKLKKYLKEKEILDIILFGSFVKGNENPSDIDVAFITRKNIEIDNSDFHIAVLTPEDFFNKPPTLVNTLLREGYSLKHNKSFVKSFNFSPKVLFNYNLSSLTPSLKVQTVNALRGRKGENGLVLEHGGEWISNNVFIVDSNNENLFEKFFLNFKIKFQKRYILIH
ncbi:nucleotidyltransferase domain-containing protein [Candidatus Pacearchaeota archaeon]|nr:nucleotidyltransferase domain-containing protein [Candidatus Pacearchaeota archaeon]